MLCCACIAAVHTRLPSMCAAGRQPLRSPACHAVSWLRERACHVAAWFFQVWFTCGRDRARVIPAPQRGPNFCNDGRLSGRLLPAPAQQQGTPPARGVSTHSLRPPRQANQHHHSYQSLKNSIRLSHHCGGIPVAEGSTCLVPLCCTSLEGCISGLGTAWSVCWSRGECRSECSRAKQGRLSCVCVLVWPSTALTLDRVHILQTATQAGDRRNLTEHA